MWRYLVNEDATYGCVRFIVPRFRLFKRPHGVEQSNRMTPSLVFDGEENCKRSIPMSGEDTISERLKFNLIDRETVAALREAKSFVLAELP